MPGLRPPTFDFATAPADEALLADRCAWLTTDEGSPFHSSFNAQRYFPDRLEIVTGPVRLTISADGRAERRYEDFGEYRAMLQTLFGIDEPELEAVWQNETEPPPVQSAPSATL